MRSSLAGMPAGRTGALITGQFSLACRTRCGEAVARGSDGYLAVYAAGDSAIVAVVGTSSLNVGMLQYRAREIIERIAANSSRIGALAAPVRPANGEPAKNTRSLPRRRPAASS